MKFTSLRVAAATTLASLLLTVSLHAEPTAELEKQALTHSRQAAELNRQGDRASALEHYRLAVQLAPTALRVLNLASAYQDASNMPAAMGQWRRLKQEFWNELSPSQQQYAVEQLQQLSLVVAELQITVEPVGAAISIDGIAMGRGPLRQSWLLPPGEHRLELAKAEGPPELRTITLQPNAVAQLVFAASVTNVPSPVTAAPGASARGPAPIDVALWTGAAGTVATGAVAGIFWALASSSKSDYDARVKVYLTGSIEADDPELQRARSDTRTYGHWAVGLGLTAGVLGIGTAATYVLTKHRFWSSNVSASARGLTIRF